MNRLYKKAFRSRLIGFCSSLGLTLTTYMVIVYFQSLPFGKEAAVLIILLLAALQFFLQCIFFLDLWKEDGPLWNLCAFLSTLSIVVTIIVFSIWIMHHLDYNMMP